MGRRTPESGSNAHPERLTGPRKKWSGPADHAEAQIRPVVGGEG